jgi:predicted ATP-grasp superfamily ATP-dependent carboligase
VPVTAADRVPDTLAGASRFASARAVYPDAATDPRAFQQWLVEHVRANPGTVVFPMTDLTLPLALAVRDSLPAGALPFPPLTSYNFLSDKLLTAEAAQRVGIAVPKTVSVSRARLAQTDVRALRYPVVLKPQVSVLRVGTGVVKEGVRYLASPEELEAYLRSHPFPDDAPFLAQEIVTGRGCGVFVLFDRGKPLGFFSHQRLRERPPSGGVSVLSESVPLDGVLCERVARLFAAHDWHGVAMAEFKLSADGEPYMIEVNGRFWGSLQLAIDSGVDFPWLLYKLARGEPAPVPQSYAIGRRLRWLLGDLDHLLLTLRGRPGAGGTLRALWRFVKYNGPSTRLELLRLDDPRPAWRALLRYLS